VRAAIGFGGDVASGSISLSEGIAGRIATTGKELLLHRDEVGRLGVSPWLRGAGLNALYGVPLAVGGSVIGVAHIGTRRATDFSEPEKRLFRAMADRAAWAVSRQLSRERLLAVLESAPALIGIWRAPDFVCEFANAAFRRQYGGREVAGRRWIDLAGGPADVPLLTGVLERGTAFTLQEVPVVRDWGGDGRLEERVFRLVLQPLGEELGRPGALLSFAIDLTDEIRTRRQLEQSERDRDRLLELERDARREAEAASRLKDEFLQTVSHELRTPLNAILGWTSSARRGAVSDLDRALAIVERNARAQARLIDDILDLSRIVRGKLRLEIASTDISHSLIGAVEAVRPAAEAKGVSLELDLKPGLPIVAADADRIQQVVWNLLSNGIKFTGHGGHVRLSASAAGESIRLEVSDTGEGIAPEFLPLVFEAFRQGDASTTRLHGGLGLGLAIARQLVHAHGGTIRAASEGAGRGSTFTVELPVRQGSASAGQQDHGGPLDGAAARLGAKRVLVVDDEEDTRELVRELLEQEGARVALAASADEAIDRLKSFRPDVLVTDIGMPKTDGYALLRLVRSLPRDLGGSTPAIALTAYARAEDVRRAARAGFEVHLSKPVDPMELVTRIADLAARGPRN
jgi:signal transduction histidine kinase/ActR/RegA family two-component response regulator